MTTEGFRIEKNKLTNAPIYLYTVFDYDGNGNDINFARWDKDVVFDGVTYDKFPASHDEIGENSQGEINVVNLKVSNVSRLIQGYLETYDLREKKVRIRLVFKDRLEYPDDKIDYFYYIDSYTADQDVANFLLLPKVDVLTVKLPLRVYSRNYCGWLFKGIECGYAGAETSCNKTKQRCKELANYQRFGGFPGIQSQKIYV